MIGDMARPDRYALAAATGCPGQRATLFALSIRANVVCGCVIAGTWLTDAVGEHRGSVRRHVNALADDGIIEVAHRPGGPLIVRFPTAEVVHNPAHYCAGCKEWGRALLRGGARTGARGVRAPVRAITEEENSRKTAVGSEHNADLSVAEARRIWTDARNRGRMT
jgi:hypothetical protein